MERPPQAGATVLGIRLGPLGTASGMVINSLGMNGLTAAESDGLSGVQVTLVIVGVLLAVVAAIATNFIAAHRGHVKAEKDKGVAELEGQIQLAQAALTQSLETNRSARTLLAVLDVRDWREEPEKLTSHYATVVNWFTQAAADAVTGLGLDVDAANAERTPEVTSFLQAHNRALGPERDLEGLRTLGDELRTTKLTPRINSLLSKRSKDVLARGEYERTTLLVTSVGTSLQIAGLIVAAAKDLV